MSIDTTRVDLEEIEITTTEKLLAVVLAAFLLIGGIWAYTQIDDIGRSDERSPTTYFTASERAAVAKADQARQRLGLAEVALQRSRQELELAREAYRTALDAGNTAPTLAQAYRARQREYGAAQTEVLTAQAEAKETRPAADAAVRRASNETRAAARQSELITFLGRLAFTLAMLAVGYWLLVRLRRSNSRYLPVSFAFVGFAALLAMVMAGDYLTDYIDVEQIGPFVLSLAGVLLTLAAFWWLQRYLARRIPQRRVRKGECPFCGYPVRHGEHCEGCGRPVIGECTTCHEPRRVGTFHCGTCGAP